MNRNEPCSIPGVYPMDLLARSALACTSLFLHRFLGVHLRALDRRVAYGEYPAHNGSDRGRSSAQRGAARAHVRSGARIGEANCMLVRQS